MKTLRNLLYPALVATAITALSAVQGFADQNTSAFLVVRCTTTLSVELFSRPAGGGLPAKTTYYDFGDMGAASTATTLNPIGVRNNSIGVISRWELDVLESGGVIDPGSQWTLGSTPGLNRATLCAKFSSSTITSTDFDMVQDTVPMTSQAAKTYSMNSFYSHCDQYVQSSYTSDPSRVLPSSYDNTAEGKAERQLWVKLLTPTAIENPGVVTTIMLRITAK